MSLKATRNASSFSASVVMVYPHARRALLADGPGLGLRYPGRCRDLASANPAHLRTGVGLLLVLYSLYGLARPAMKPLTAGVAPADVGAGFINGLIGGTTGLAGVFATVWFRDVRLWLG